MCTLSNAEPIHADLVTCNFDPWPFEPKPIDLDGQPIVATVPRFKSFR